ncbi:hypothetical protein AX17_001281 [Amanita inopinata Kibby_2008]|nr:hypothetical protein AX17_001281 [Amanita inopinata Kibby_2008]
MVSPATGLNLLQLKSIPTVGPQGMLTSYIGAFHFLFHAQEMVQEGYEKYRGSMFKVPTMAMWMIVVHGPQKINDIRRASDEYLSFRRAILETLHTDLTIDPELEMKPIHVDVVRSLLTRNIGARFPDVQDEIVAAFADYIPGKTGDWVKIPAYKTLMGIVCRTSNRL